ncbi:hypothetical protein G1C97_0463 [Bifidobacterium sp. DSM 109959]|uniref:Uncharacterized protein n=1 Tax=Bifidobacterium olomucense TaxID=2675324 RepID=A0A7Y0EW45_9BIFI|nr:hypothetical protein [Bifidobacterium sp. DSM 109959]
MGVGRGDDVSASVELLRGLGWVRFTGARADGACVNESSVSCRTVARGA